MSTTTAVTATPRRIDSTRCVTPILSASGARKANVPLVNLPVAALSSLLGRNNLIALVTPIIARYQTRFESPSASSDKGWLYPFPAPPFSSKHVARPTNLR